MDDQLTTVVLVQIWKNLNKNNRFVGRKVRNMETGLVQIDELLETLHNFDQRKLIQQTRMQNQTAVSCKTTCEIDQHLRLHLPEHGGFP